MEKNTYQKIYKEAVAIANHASILCSPRARTNLIICPTKTTMRSGIKT